MIHHKIDALIVGLPSMVIYKMCMPCKLPNLRQVYSSMHGPLLLVVVRVHDAFDRSQISKETSFYVSHRFVFSGKVQKEKTGTLCCLTTYIEQKTAKQRYLLAKRWLLHVSTSDVIHRRTICTCTQNRRTSSLVVRAKSGSFYFPGKKLLMSQKFEK